MGTFGKVKKYSKPSLSLEIEEKAKLLEKELRKTHSTIRAGTKDTCQMLNIPL